MIVTLGDSVCWGQGLAEDHKFVYLFAQERGLPFARVAHSGAVIGTASDASREVEPGEIPGAGMKCIVFDLSKGIVPSVPGIKSRRICLCVGNSDKSPSQHLPLAQ